jgi:hypothetical protein
MSIVVPDAAALVEPPVAADDDDELVEQPAAAIVTTVMAAAAATHLFVFKLISSRDPISLCRLSRPKGGGLPRLPGSGRRRASC